MPTKYKILLMTHHIAVLSVLAFCVGKLANEVKHLRAERNDAYAAIAVWQMTVDRYKSIVARCGTTDHL